MAARRLFAPGEEQDLITLLAQMLLADYLPFSEMLLVTIPEAKLVPMCVPGRARSPRQPGLGGSNPAHSNGLELDEL